MREWNRKNVDRISAQRRAARAADPERFRAAEKVKYYRDVPAAMEKRKRDYHKNREARLAWHKKYREDNPELIRDRQAKSYLEHREQRLEYAKANKGRANALRREWNKLHKQEVAERKRLEYQRTRERCIARAKTWHDANLERHKENLKRNYAENRATYISRARARQKGLVGSFTQAEAKQLYLIQDGKCAGCAKSLAEGYEHDHVMPVSRGGVNTIDNIQLLCVACNRSKRATLPEEWAAKIGKLFV
jgi:hypothetical protein